ncbi:MAG: hypothetical protein LBU23_13825 [Planctomycetota bacterium]|jgi:hypothetical protein|nr:hypothetical protein [Planctomycetota bacterium]
MTAGRISNLETDWDAIMNDPAVGMATRFAPANASECHDEGNADKLLEDMRRNTPWMKQLMVEVIADRQ